MDKKTNISFPVYDSRYYNDQIFDVTNNSYSGEYNISNGSFNITRNSIILTGLSHFTEYQIMVVY